MSTTLTARDVVAKALELAKARPEFVYRAPTLTGRCLYIHDGDGSCLFGQALVSLGVDTREMTFVQEMALAQATDAIDTMLEQLPIRTDWPTSNARDLTKRAQSLQDTGHQWAEIIPMLEEALAEWEAIS